MSEYNNDACYGFINWLFIILGTILAVFGGQLIEVWGFAIWFLTNYLYIISFFLGIGLGIIIGESISKEKK